MTIEAIDITSLDAFEHDVDEAVSQSAPLEPIRKMKTMRLAVSSGWRFVGHRVDDQGQLVLEVEPIT